MKNHKIITFAINQPLDSDSNLKRKMANVVKRAQRQSPRFPGLDLHAIQRDRKPKPP
jgi:hypothetical protein